MPIITPALMGTPSPALEQRLGFYPTPALLHLHTWGPDGHAGGRLPCQTPRLGKKNKADSGDHGDGGLQNEEPFHQAWFMILFRGKTEIRAPFRALFAV